MSSPLGEYITKDDHKKVNQDISLMDLIKNNMGAML